MNNDHKKQENHEKESEEEAMQERMIDMPAKFRRCVKEVKGKIAQSGYPGNAYAICRVSTNYYGPTRHKTR